MEPHVVIASSLNLRRAPVLERENIIATLPHGHEVDVIDQSDSRFWQVRTSLQGRLLRGFASARYLVGKSTQPPPESNVRAVHYREHSESRLDSIGFRHCPLAKSLSHGRDPAAPSAAKVTALHGIVSVLDVERSRRYRPTATSTYCNVYAYDFCYFAAAYLPRVWWTSKALIQLENGNAQPVEYGVTVRELNANALYDWLVEWGDDFGWKAAATVDDLQANVNEGAVGIVCAQRQNLSRSGHIVAVLPETADLGAVRAGGRVIAPLQSQAGAVNKRYFASDWWIQRAAEYRAVGFWHHA